MAAIERRHSYPSNLTFLPQMNMVLLLGGLVALQTVSLPESLSDTGTELGIGFTVSMGVSVLEDKNSVDRLI